jgi:hypothetical protein
MVSSQFGDVPGIKVCNNRRASGDRFVSHKAECFRPNGPDDCSVNAASIYGRSHRIRPIPNNRDLLKLATGAYRLLGSQVEKLVPVVGLELVDQALEGVPALVIGGMT